MEIIENRKRLDKFSIAAWLLAGFNLVWLYFWLPWGYGYFGFGVLWHSERFRVNVFATGVAVLLFDAFTLVIAFRKRRCVGLSCIWLACAAYSLWAIASWLKTTKQ